MNIYSLLFAPYKSQHHQSNSRGKKNEQKTILFRRCLSTCAVAVVTRLLLQVDSASNQIKWTIICRLIISWNANKELQPLMPIFCVSLCHLRQKKKTQMNFELKMPIHATVQLTEQRKPSSKTEGMKIRLVAFFSCCFSLSFLWWRSGEREREMTKSKIEFSPLVLFLIFSWFACIRMWRSRSCRHPLSTVDVYSSHSHNFTILVRKKKSVQLFGDTICASILCMATWKINFSLWRMATFCNSYDSTQSSSSVRTNGVRLTNSQSMLFRDRKFGKVFRLRISWATVLTAPLTHSLCVLRNSVANAKHPVATGTRRVAHKLFDISFGKVFAVFHELSPCSRAPNASATNGNFTLAAMAANRYIKTKKSK